MGNEIAGRKPQKSLKDELAKRKTQEIQRVIEQKQIDRARGGMPSDVNLPSADQMVASSAQPTPAPDIRRTTQTSAISAPFKPRNARLSARQIRVLIGAVAATLSLIVCAVSVLLFTNQPTNAAMAMPALAALPVVSASDVVAYLKKADFPVSNVRSLAVTGDQWLATEETHVEAQQGTHKGLFVIVSYPSADQKVPDIFKAARGKFKTWKVISASNILVLVSPDTAPALSQALGSHIAQYIFAPYRPLVPTATPRSFPAPHNDRHDYAPSTQ